MSNWRSTSTLEDLINNLDDSDLNELCSKYCNSDNVESDFDSEYYACQLLSLLECYGAQFMKLILIILFLYWWNNQSMNCYLMNTNCQLSNTVSDLLEDCFECNCCNKKK